MYQIAPLKSNRPLAYHPSFDSYFDALAYAQILNAEHRRIETGYVFKVVSNISIDVESLT